MSFTLSQVGLNTTYTSIFIRVFLLLADEKIERQWSLDDWRTRFSFFDLYGKDLLWIIVNKVIVQQIWCQIITKNSPIQLLKK